jgi:hypothetical protein
VLIALWGSRVWRWLIFASLHIVSVLVSVSLFIHVSCMRVRRSIFFDLVALSRGLVSHVIAGNVVGRRIRGRRFVRCRRRFFRSLELVKEGGHLRRGRDGGVRVLFEELDGRGKRSYKTVVG